MYNIYDNGNINSEGIYIENFEYIPYFELTEKEKHEILEAEYNNTK